MLNSSNIDFLLSFEEKNYDWNTLSASRKKKALELETHLLIEQKEYNMYVLTDRGQKAIDRLVSCINNDLGIQYETLPTNSI